MKNLLKNWFGFFIVMPLFLFQLNGCKKDNINPTNGKTSAVFKPSVKYGTMTDQDGNTYKTVAIGSQIWMAENLRTTKYRNDDPIPLDTSALIWQNITTGAYCNNSNTNNIDNIATFGRLYNWYAVNDIRNIAPKGWHVPSDSEWTTLTDFNGYDAGGKLKEAGTNHWQSPNTDATNATGFTALPCNCRSSDGYFNSIESSSGYWWSSSEGGTDNVWDWNMNNNSSGVVSYYDYKRDGFSVRCLKDN